MTRSFKIDDLIPWFVYQTRETPEAIRQELLRLNVDEDPGMDWVPGDGPVPDEFITDFEFYKHKEKINPLLRERVAFFFEKNMDVYRVKIAGHSHEGRGDDLVIVDDGDSLLEGNDFSFDVNAPKEWVKGQSSEILDDALKARGVSLAPHANLPYLLLKLSDQSHIGIVDTAKIVKALPNLFAASPEKYDSLREVNEEAEHFVIKQFAEALSENINPFRIQNLFIQLLLMAEKGWGHDLFDAFKLISSEQWNVVLNHPTLPLKAARAFAKAIEGNDASHVDTRLSEIDDENLPVPYRLLVASSLCYHRDEHQLTNGGLTKVKDILFDALSAEGTIHPAFRIMALESLGALSDAGKLEDGDIDKLFTFLQNYKSITEADIKSILTPAQYDRDVMQAVTQMQQQLELPFPADETEAAPIEEEGSDYGVKGVLTYWLMDYNHKIVTKTFDTILAHHDPQYVAASITGFMLRNRADDPAIPKDQAYVEYYKVVEALNALGKLYRVKSWTGLAFNLHQNNQIGREFERDPAKMEALLKAFEDHSKQRAWDSKSLILTRNFAACQLVRYFLEVDQHADTLLIDDWLKNLGRDQLKDILDYKFNNKEPRPGLQLQSVLEVSKRPLTQFIKHVWPEVNFDVFKNWLDWADNKCFIYKPNEAIVRFDFARQEFIEDKATVDLASTQTENPLAASWDTPEKVLYKNYIALQIARYAFEKVPPVGNIAAWWKELPESQRKTILATPYLSGPHDGFDAYVYAHRTELLTIVPEKDALPDNLTLSTTSFQNWQNWQHFGPFIIDGVTAIQQAFKADIMRKAWSWEFFEISLDDFLKDYLLYSPEPEKKKVEKERVMLSFLDAIEKHPFGYLRADLIEGLTGDKFKAWPKVQEKAREVLDLLKLPTKDNEWQAYGKIPKRVALPPTDEHGLYKPYHFGNRYGHVFDINRFAKLKDKVDTPTDAAPHLYHEQLRKLSSRYGEEAVEYLVDLVEEKTNTHPHQNKFRYIAERYDLKNVGWWLIANLADVLFKDAAIEKMFMDSYIHASGSKNNPFKKLIEWVVQKFIQGWNTKHQSTFLELVREFHLTYESGSPVEHLAYVGFNFVRTQYILACLRDAIAQGYDPIVYMTEKLEVIESKMVKFKDEESDEYQLLLEQRRQILDYMVQARLGYEPEAMMDL